MTEKNKTGASKAWSYSHLQEETLKTISSSGAEWAKFLDCSSRFYKYSFDDQALIYAQRPNATACAPLPVWNDIFDRRVSKGAKGIALLVPPTPGKSSVFSLRYVFDVADTWSQNKSGIVLWTFNADRHTEVLREAFGDVGDIEGEADAKKIIKHTAESHLANVELDYISDAGALFFVRSVAYIVENRCNLNGGKLLADNPNYFDMVSRLSFAEFDYLSTEISIVAHGMLQEIEKGVKLYEAERGIHHGRRDQIQRVGRRLPSARLGTSRAVSGGQVWQDAAEVPRGVPETRVSTDVQGSDTESILGGAGQESGGTSRSADRESVSTGTSPTKERAKSGMGRTHEQPQAQSGRNNVQRVDLPRGKLDPVNSLGQQDLFPTAAEPREVFSSASSAAASEVLPESSSLDQNAPNWDEEIEYVLLKHSHVSGSRYEIYRLITNKDLKNAEIEKAIYKKYGTIAGGHSHALTNGSGFMNYSSSGISLDCWSSHTTMSLSWGKVRAKYQDLIQAGRFISEDEIAIREGYYSSDLPLIKQEEIDCMFHLPYSERDLPRFYEILDSDSSLVDLNPFDRAMIKHSSINQFMGARRYNLYVTPDSEGLLFSKEGHRLEFWSWDQTLDYMRDFFTRDNIQQQSQTDDEPPRGDAAEATLANENETLPLLDFRITDDSLGVGSLQQRARNNIAAIRLIKELKEQDLHANADQQKVLSLYTGWGSIPQVFNDLIGSGWQHAVREELHELLTPSEYRDARASTLTSFYTSPVVVRSMYKALEQLGFEKGNILEPSMGVGNFFGMLPDSVRDNSQLYGVEIDNITGAIAKELYQNANISVCGYEKTDFSDNMFDVAVGNVPFGAFPVFDKLFDRHKFMIHDYFFAKTLDKVRPGGVIAFVTSKGTLDKANSKVRKYIAQRAELLGAVRLPNNAFTANAGTGVTSDIIFLKKREKRIDIVPEWVYTAKDSNDIVINQYFVDNPQMVLGTMVQEQTLYGNSTETTCVPSPGMNLEASLEKVIRENIRGHMSIYHHDRTDTAGRGKETRIPADPYVRNHSYTLVNDEDIYFRENSEMSQVTGLSHDNLRRLRGLVLICDTAKEIISLQLEGGTDEQIQQVQIILNDLYDKFIVEFGRINEKQNAKVFERDSGYYLLCSLEELDENRNFVQKAPFFYKRTVREINVPNQVGSAVDALTLSISEKAEVDLDYMSQLTGHNEQSLIDDLQDLIYANPVASTTEKTVYVTASEYLSGNIRVKLAQANLAEMAFQGKFTANVKALEKAMPIQLNASEISVRLGSTWVDSKYIKQFIDETIMPMSWAKIDVEYVAYDSSWVITGKSSDKESNVRVNSTYGTKRANAYSILEDSLNLRDTRVFDTIPDPETGKEKRVVNATETAKAQQKQEELKQLFNDWIFKNPQRREYLVKKYNDLYNSSRPREYDGSHLKFFGMNPEITLQKHQVDGVARVLYGPNSLLAHEVGAGKTYVMAAGMVESKRLGLCKKSMWVVPNHLTEQAASEFLSLYPGANILVATKKDFETKNRKKFCARIATGEYDAVILGFSQFEKIPISTPRQQRILEEQIDELVEMVGRIKHSSGMRTTVKRMEKTRRSLETRLKKLNDQSRKDDVVTFEELGVDKLVIDEAHNYKNLFFTTKMRNVAGLAQTEAQKSSDLYMKCRYMDEITEGKGILFATGTPISNSMTEMYTMMSYLQHQTLREMQLHHFDAWASSFGETTVSVELAPEGTGYRAKTRFAKFFNLPELMTLFKTSADIKTADTLNLDRPDANYHTISVNPTSYQKKLMQSLSDRASLVHSKMVDAREDNMLKITTDGRKIGLDQRLYDPLLPDEDGTKVNACADNVFRIWEENQSTSATQLVFCDFSTPSKTKFNMYDDLKDKLIKRGLPSEEIAFIHDADSEMKKDALFAKVRTGQIRVLMGSTAKMGAGTNVQDKLIASHDLDCPWRPSDLEQRAGRTIRQGNTNKSVHIFRYVTKDTFDAYLYQTVENKQKFISQIMTSKSPVRSCEDVDESVLQYAEIKALCAGNPKIKEKMDLDVKVSKLQIAKSSYLSNRYALEDKILKGLPQQIRLGEEERLALENDLEYYLRHQPTAQMKSDHEKQEKMFVGMTFEDRICTTKEAAGNKILDIRDRVTGGTDNPYVGEYYGFAMDMNYSPVNKEFYLRLRNKDENGLRHSVALGTDTLGNITRIDNMFNRLEGQLETVQFSVEEYKKELKQCEDALKAPFAFEDELHDATNRLNVLNVELSLEAPSAVPETDGKNVPETDSIPQAKDAAWETKKTSSFKNKDKDEGYSR